METILEPSATMLPMLNEFREEAAITKRALQRVPANRLGWKPHPRSMSLGQLSLHIATIPSRLSQLAQLDGFDVSQANFDPPHPKNMEEVLAAHEQSVLDAEKCLQEMTEEQAQAKWRLMKKDKELFTKPRAAILRSILLNHWYHHRGQLSVYLRLLDVPVPVIYGRSADESPFD
ncbi:MAG TPA: DinB family protein [Acidobacteriota bacterium]|nr:DinB family protein [Acidobacteriota bacterium]